MKKYLILILILIVCVNFSFADELGSGDTSGYPTEIDTDVTKETSTTVAHWHTPNSLGDAVVNMQTELGTSPAGGYGTVRERFEAILASTGTLDALKQTAAQVASATTSAVTPYMRDHSLRGEFPSNAYPSDSIAVIYGWPYDVIIGTFIVQYAVPIGTSAVGTDGYELVMSTWMVGTGVSRTNHFDQVLVDSDTFKITNDSYVELHTGDFNYSGVIPAWSVLQLNIKVVGATRPGGDPIIWTLVVYKKP